MDLFFIGILFLILGGVFSLFFSEKVKLKLISVFSILSTLSVFLSLFRETPPFSMNIIPFGHVEFAIDNLSAFFVLVISVITTIACVYSIGYMRPYMGKEKKFSLHCLFLPLLAASMLLVVTVQNAFFFLIVWEVMSLSSFFLVIFEDDKKEVLKSGIKYLIYMHVSVIFIMAAFILMSIKSGSYEFSSFHDIFIAHPYLKDIVFILAFIGFGTKAGFFPMHNWLPDAHPAAPSHVSAIMSAVMIKTGIYGIIRVLLFISEPTEFIAYTLLIVSVLTALYGIIYAVNQKDIKKLLAYSSVENIGIIGIALSIVLFGQIYNNYFITFLGTVGCFMHILNHSVFKSLLFMCAGSIYVKTHTKNIELLGGLIKKMPKTAICFLFGCIAICAFPPLNGFVGEFLIYIGLFNLLSINNSILFISIILAISALAFVGTLVILAMSKIYSISFLGLPRSEHSENVTSDVPRTMVISMASLSFLTLAIGVASPLCLFVLPSGVFVPESANISIDLIITISSILISVSVIVLMFLILIGIIFLIRNHFAKKAVQYETWGCGYDKGNNHIQYTGSSYISPFTSILTPLFKKIFDVKKPKGLFPKDAHYTAKVEDVEEAYIINPILKFDEKFLSRFERLQDGNIQHYILYGLIFLIIMLVGVVIYG